MGNTTSCVSKAPFIKLEDTGQAAILNYNLPQETTYNAISHIALDVSKELFKTTEVTQTTSPTWTVGRRFF